jgi:hypothetical protein
MRRSEANQRLAWLKDWRCDMSTSREAPRPWTLDEEKKLDDLLEAGKDAAEIAVELQRTRQAIYGRLQRLYRKRAKPRTVSA